MAATSNIPSCRNLDIYRLVIVRGCKQLDVASSFDISPVRACQIVARVHAWVAQSLPEWFWKGRPELRFQAALAYERIRLLECEDDPETVTFLGPSWTYKRQNRVVSLTASQSQFPSSSTSEPSPTPPLMQPHTGPHTTSELSPPELNFIPGQQGAEIAATPNDAIHSADPHLVRLAHHFAQILMLWKKTQRHASTSPPHRGHHAPA